jgi:hypothetical protein
LGEVIVDDPGHVLARLAEETGTTIEDIAGSLGKTVEEAKEAIDIVEMPEPRASKSSVRKRVEFPPLPRRQMFG